MKKPDIEKLVGEVRDCMRDAAIFSKDEKSFVLNSIDNINKHISVLNDEHGDLCVKVAGMEANQQQLLWLNRLVLGTLITGIVGAILLLVLK